MLQYRGKTFQAKKIEGTHRATRPEKTIGLIKPFFHQFGITRIANITHLDRIGIPVTASIRPNATTLSINSGKGITYEDAYVSGAMEAMEFAIAEEVKMPTFEAKYAEMVHEVPCIAIKDMALTANNVFHPKIPEIWSWGWDIVNQRNVAVPAAQIGMNCDLLNGRFMNFQIGSNGLAAGGNFLEAVASGLAEVIERDGWTLHEWNLKKQTMMYPRVRIDTIESVKVLKLLDKIHRAGLKTYIYDLTTDIGVHVFKAMIVDKEVESIGVFAGYGCHLDPETALTRCITEAVQGRACYIAGARDDMFRRMFMILKKAQSSWVIESLDAWPATVDMREKRDESTETLEGDIAVMTGKLVERGFETVLVADISNPIVDIKVVHVLVPGLEGHVFEFYKEGWRVKEFMESKAKEEQVA